METNTERQNPNNTSKNRRNTVPSNRLRKKQVTAKVKRSLTPEFELASLQKEN